MVDFGEKRVVLLACFAPGKVCLINRHRESRPKSHVFFSSLDVSFERDIS